MRRALVAAVPVLLVLAPLASAAPTAAPTTAAAAHLQLVSGGHTSDVALLVTTPQQGSPQLRLRIASDAGVVTRWYGELPAGAVTSTGGATQGTTTLRARIGGLPLTVVWHVSPLALMVSMGETDSDGSDATTQGWSAVGTGGNVDVSLGAMRCRLDVGLVGSAVTYETGAYGKPLATRLALPRGTSCRQSPSSLPTVP